MKRERFPLTSEQMELLLAFEQAGNLEKLANVMAKDPSVISRNLQKLASELPVLTKTAGRWQLSPLGRQLNILSRKHLAGFEKLLSSTSKKRSEPLRTVVPEKAVLIAINIQKALHDPARGRRSNSSAEAHIRQLFELWRKKKWPLIHVKHLSENPASFLYKKALGAEFIEGFEPRAGELTIKKAKASAFAGTKLKKIIRDLETDAIVLVGFTGGECIDATARQASDFGFKTFVVGDATATFDIVGPNGELHKAEKVHKSMLANLHANFAKILETNHLLR